MAATDEFENQLPIQNTGKWIRALDANGSPILIPVEEIAKVGGRTIAGYFGDFKGILFKS